MDVNENAFERRFTVDVLSIIGAVLAMIGLIFAYLGYQKQQTMDLMFEDGVSVPARILSEVEDVNPIFVIVPGPPLKVDLAWETPSGEPRAAEGVRLYPEAVRQFYADGFWLSKVLEIAYLPAHPDIKPIANINLEGQYERAKSGKRYGAAFFVIGVLLLLASLLVARKKEFRL